MKNRRTFTRMIHGETPVLAYFYTNKDSSCRTMHTILKLVTHHLERKLKISLIDIDVSTNQKIIKQYLQLPRPTFMLFHNGQIKWKDSGTFTSRSLITIIEEKLNL